MDVKTNVYKRMLRSRLPWQLDLFSSQTKTFVYEITARIRAWKQADSCSEDLPLAIQIGQCLLLVGFNGKFAFSTAAVGRWTNRTEGTPASGDNSTKRKRKKTPIFTASILAFEENVVRRKVRETIEIRDHRPKINCNGGWQLD